MATKEKKSFRMPHLLFLLLALLILISVLTYILPAGQFVDLADGGKEYVFIERTPIHIGKALLYIYDGIVNNAPIIAGLLAVGGSIEVVLGSRALDRIIDACLYKLQDKGSSVLLPVMFFLMALLGAFGGGDALVAVIPIGVLFAKKLRLDPVVAAGVSFMGTIVGGATSPTAIFIAQSLLGMASHCTPALGCASSTCCCAAPSAPSI